MNFCLIFAGGTGQRMNTVSLPKQFLRIYSKEIIIHTLEKYEKNSNTDSIVVVCVEEYIEELKKLINKYNVSKVVGIVPGGKTGQESIYNGLLKINELSKSSKDIVLVHDGVRPIIDNETINKVIDSVRLKGSGITVTQSIETILYCNIDDYIEDVFDRSKCFMARAPQGFYFNDLLSAHKKAMKEGKTDFIDSASIMKYYGCKLFYVIGPQNNIKITTPIDYFVLKSLFDIEENRQIRFVED